MLVAADQSNYSSQQKRAKQISPIRGAIPDTPFTNDQGKEDKDDSDVLKRYETEWGYYELKRPGKKSRQTAEEQSPASSSSSEEENRKRRSGNEFPFDEESLRHAQRVQPGKLKNTCRDVRCKLRQYPFLFFPFNNDLAGNNDDPDMGEDIDGDGSSGTDTFVDFSYQPSEPRAGELILFTASVTGSITNPSFTFHDGMVAYALEATYTYPAPGEYLVTFSASTDEDETISISKQVLISGDDTSGGTTDDTLNSSGDDLHANFSISPEESIIAGETTVEFIDQSAPGENIVSWEWSVNGVVQSTSQNPTVLFSEAGEYNITLTITSSDGSNHTITKTVVVDSKEVQIPSCDLTASPTFVSTYAPVQVSEARTFRFRASVNATRAGYESRCYIDGVLQSSNVSYCEYSFPPLAPGRPQWMNITFLACNQTDVVVHTQRVMGQDMGPIVRFSYVPTEITAGEPVTFTDNTYTILDPLVRWEWNFGDGETSTVQNATHTFLREGLYQVALKVTDSDGSFGGLTKNITVQRPEILPDNASILKTSSFVYDDNGNLIEDGNYYYNYDSFNRLSSITNKKSGVIIEQYWYDHEGQRIKKVSQASGTPVTEYYLDNMVRVDDGSSTRSEVSVFHNGQRVGSLQDETTLFYHPDHLESTDVTTDINGDIVEEVTYSPFGRILSGENMRYLYTGQERDATGLFYYGSRYYNPAIARFTQPDKIIADVYNPQNLNKYSYALNNPYKYTDPNGEFVWFVIGAIVTLAFIAWDAYDVYHDPSPTNIAMLGLDFVPGAGAISKVGKVGKVAKAVGKAGKAAGKAKDASKAFSKAAKAEKASKAKKAESAFGKGATSKAAKAEKLVPDGYADPRELWRSQSYREDSQRKIKRMTKSLTEGEDIKKPIEIIFHKGKQIIVDGHHRTRAHIAAGKDKIPYVDVTNRPLHNYGTRTTQQVIDDAEEVAITDRYRHRWYGD